MAESVATYGAARPREMVGGSLTEASGGAAAIILAILGLISIAPAQMVAIATIVLGVSFVLLGGLMAVRFSRTFSASETGAMPGEALSEGIAVESMCGGTGVVLGILALLGPNAPVLIPAAVIVFGAGLLVASATVARADAVNQAHGSLPHPIAMPGPEALIGLSGIVLGVLALAGFTPLTLSLVAVLTYGFAVMLKGTSLANTVFSFFKV